MHREAIASGAQGACPAGLTKLEYSAPAPLLRELAVAPFVNLAGERTAAPLAIGLFQIHPHQTGATQDRPAVPEQATESAGQRAYPLHHAGRD